MSSSIKELAGPVAEIDPADAELCARLIARYAESPDDGDLIADVLGLDDGVRFWSEKQLAARINRLADSIDVSNCGNCGYRRTSANHRTLCGRAA